MCWRWPGSSASRRPRRLPELLPLAHVIGVHGVTVDLDITDTGVEIHATVRTADRTGGRWRLPTSVTVAALAVIDMVKGPTGSRTSSTSGCSPREGGRSGRWIRHPEATNSPGR